MAKIQFPEGVHTEGQVIEHEGKKLVYTGGSWVPQQKYTAGSGGMTSAEVGTIVDGKITAADVGGQIDAKIQSLHLGNMATSNMHVSNNPPDNLVGENGDLWIQTS